METVSLKMEKSLLNEIDESLEKNRYATRTEFMRDAIRTKLSDLEKEEIFKKLDAFKGSLKGKAKSNMSDEEVRELVGRETAKKFGIKLD
ncbi:hypothetical protein J4404_01560 [Candidatus Woesearchaeota archaeon]|nr:hypothetical protein [Candidatus Woesearchaeota archaeon]